MHLMTSQPVLSAPARSYRRLTCVKDRKLDTTDLSRYHLSVYVGHSCLKVSCFDIETARCVLLEVYTWIHSQETSQRFQAIEQLYRDHPLLAANNWSLVTLCVDNQQYTLVPQAFVQEERLGDYLNFVCQTEADNVKHCTLPLLGIAVVFAVDSGLLSKFQTAYPGVPQRIVHQANSLIQGTWTYFNEKKLGPWPRMLIFTASHRLHIMATQRDTLLYYNRFEYTSDDKLAYYVLVAMRTLGFDPDLQEVVLGGDITQNPSTYRKVRSCVRRCTLANIPAYLQHRRILSKKVVRMHLDVLSTHLLYSK